MKTQAIIFQKAPVLTVIFCHLSHLLENSHRQIESRGQNQRTSDDFSNPQFQFEMKFDSLKNYVDSVTTAVNQHASILNKLRTDINLRVVEKNVSTYSFKSIMGLAF
jgi:hypothetical protein